MALPAVSGPPAARHALPLLRAPRLSPLRLQLCLLSSASAVPQEHSAHLQMITLAAMQLPDTVQEELTCHAADSEQGCRAGMVAPRHGRICSNKGTFGTVLLHRLPAHLIISKWRPSSRYLSGLCKNSCKVAPQQHAHLHQYRCGLAEHVPSAAFPAIHQTCDGQLWSATDCPARRHACCAPSVRAGKTPRGCSPKKRKQAGL